ncbi:hypothetical protein FCL40_01065 [Ferrimonas sediminicola]|uniref:Uncharacterized protein n=1 Tax=Ferrimonas sediminicola TaxID=2569538 RepID=A0A4U1BKM6_9GAMM|nr:hypothetical protein [Ferrimonas sediminicola]TKB51177.1 hypothetical protein FCL40_01065 [Ferrimonas sediminicola]
MTPVERLLSLLLWLEVAVAPALLCALLGSVYCIFADRLELNLVAWWAAAGLIPGVVAAEYLRRHRGLMLPNAVAPAKPGKKRIRKA